MLPSCVYVSSRIEDSRCGRAYEQSAEDHPGPGPDADYEPSQLLGILREASIPMNGERMSLLPSGRNTSSSQLRTCFSSVQ